MHYHPRLLLREFLARRHFRRMKQGEIARAEGCLLNLRDQGREITAEQERQCVEYSNEVLGDDRYATWLKVFTAVQSTFKEGWIPPNYYENVVIPKLKSSYGHVGSMNALVVHIFPELTGPDAVFPNVAYFAGGNFFSHLMEPISDDRVSSVLFKDREQVVFKTDGSFGGSGIHFINRTEFDIVRIRKLGMGVFQSIIKQHPTFDRFHPLSVATLRINTVVSSNGEVTMPMAMMRIGTGADTHVKTASNVRVPIGPSGSLFRLGSKVGFHLVSRHPGTELEYEGVVIPKYQEAVDMCIELQRKLPFICSIGWDISIDADERVRIMEYNTRHNGFLYAEGLVGPNFKDFGWEKLWRR